MSYQLLDVSCTSFPNSVWERSFAKLCFACPRVAPNACDWPKPACESLDVISGVIHARETEFRRQRSQTEFGNEGIVIANFP